MNFKTARFRQTINFYPVIFVNEVKKVEIPAGGVLRTLIFFSYARFCVPFLY